MMDSKTFLQVLPNMKAATTTCELRNRIDFDVMMFREVATIRIMMMLTKTFTILCSLC